jgi:hypothetical protein
LNNITKFAFRPTVHTVFKVFEMEFVVLSLLKIFTELVIRPGFARVLS